MTESTPLLSHNEMVELAKEIQWQIDELIKQLRGCHLMHASVAVLPRHSVDENGYDSVFDPVSSMALDQLEGTEALNHALESLKFYERHRDFASKNPELLSQVAARRSAGIVHLLPFSFIQERNIRNLVHSINKNKVLLKDNLADNYKTSYARRTKFYQAHFPQFMPKTITRLIHIAPEHTTRVHFSWLNKGYTVEPMDEKQVLSFITNLNKKKLELNPDLGLELKQLVEIDTNKLGQHKHFFRTMPAKLHPLQRVTAMEEGVPVQTPSQRAVVPLVVLQKQPLLTYGKLNSLDSLDQLRKCINRKLVDHRPVIEEYHLYVGRERRD